MRTFRVFAASTAVVLALSAPGLAGAQQPGAQQPGGLPQQPGQNQPGLQRQAPQPRQTPPGLQPAQPGQPVQRAQPPIQRELAEQFVPRVQPVEPQVQPGASGIIAGLFDAATANVVPLLQAQVAPGLVDWYLTGGGRQARPIRVVFVDGPLAGDPSQAAIVREAVRQSAFLQQNAQLARNAIRNSTVLTQRLRDYPLEPANVVALDLLGPRPAIFALLPQTTGQPQGAIGQQPQAAQQSRQGQQTRPSAAQTGAQAQQANRVHVVIDGLSFHPNLLTIAPGTTVEWVNRDNVAHTVTSGDPAGRTPTGLFDSGVLQPGQRFTFTFDQAGTYNYFCRIHPQLMQAVVEVQR